MTGIQVVHVPYRGAPAANTSVMIGETHLLFNALPAVLERLASLGSEPFTGSPADFGRFRAEETEKWAKVVKFTNLKVE